MGYGKWESSDNGTAPAIDRIPKDIILCDWHYELRDHYPSVPYFQEKGFRVWPSSWNNPKAALAFLEEGRRVNKGLVIGHLGTTWVSAPHSARRSWSPAASFDQGPARRRPGRRRALWVCMNAMKASGRVGSGCPAQGQVDQPVQRQGPDRLDAQAQGL